MKSSNILQIEYSDREEKLKVWFINSPKRTYYEYEKVPPTVFGELMLAPSKGTYFAIHIKNKCDCKKVENDGK